MESKRTSGLPGGLSSNLLEEGENPEAHKKIKHPWEEDIQVDKGNKPLFYWRYIFRKFLYPKVHD